MDENFRKRLQKTMYAGELESDSDEQSPLKLTELAVEFFQGLVPHKLGHVDLQSASVITSQETVSPSSITMSMMYAKRLQRKRPEYTKNMSSSDLFLISMMMASKYLYDEGVEEEVFNDEWAENAGLEKEEINEMEMDFLQALEWEMFIKKDDFDQAMLSVERSIALKEGLERGWFSYTDLSLLLDDPALRLSMSHVGLEWLKVVMVSSTAYFAGVMTMVGSTVLVTNASVALASFGLLPVQLPGLHPSLPLPAILSGLAPSEPLSSFPSLEMPEDLWQPDRAGFLDNETEGITENKRELKSVPENPSLGLTPIKFVVDTILSQLMAVLTLKCHLVQFVSAVSEGMASGGTSNNYSASKISSCGKRAGKARLQDGDEMSTPNDALSQWFAEEEPAVFTADGLCARCGRWRSLAEPLGEWDSTSSSSYLLSDPGIRSYHKSVCCRGAMFQHSPDPLVCQKCQSAGFCHEQCRVCASNVGLDLVGGCFKEAMTGTGSSFPDITIGFSTSMPPVFAT